MSDNEFVFYWFLTFFIWNIYYLWIVPKRSAQFWGKHFGTPEGQKELVIIARSIIDKTVEETEEILHDSLETFSKSFFGSLGKNIQETKSVLKMVNPENEFLDKIGEQNPILGLIMQKIQPQLQNIMGAGGQGMDRPEEGFKKGL